MKVEKTDRGFPVIEHPVYASDTGEIARLVQQSSAVGDYPDAFVNPGSSFLYVGDAHHLNREEVVELIAHLQRWVETGDLRGE